MSNNNDTDDNNLMIIDIIKKNYSDIYKFCCSHIKNTYDAEDCTHDVFQFLIQKSNKITINTNIKAWLYKVAQYKIKEYKRMQKNVDYIEDIGNNDAISYQDSFFDNKYGSVFRYIMLSDILNENEKSLFSDYLAEQYTPKQIALKHNISENAFFIRMTRIKEKISKYIKENEIKL